MFGKRMWFSKKIKHYKDFDAQKYLLQNPDVAKSGVDPLEHFVNHGSKEGREYPVKARDSYADPEYIRVIKSGFFDPEWYLSTYPDVRFCEQGPLEHFMEFGVWEGRDPGPNFSTSWYLEQYPDIRGQNPLLHYIDHGKREGRIPAPPRNGVETAKRVFESIMDLDPALYGNERFHWFKGVAFYDSRTRSTNEKAILRNLLGKLTPDITHFVMAPWILRSGADIVVANVIESAAKIVGIRRIALIIVDYDRMEGLEWLPEELTVLNVANATEGLSPEEKLLIIEKILLATRPDKCLNVNSGLTWDLFRDRGKAVSLYSNLYACVFCRDYNHRNAPMGYADTHLRDAIPWLTKVYLDNATFKDEIIAHLGLLPDEGSKFHVAKQPVRINVHKQDRKRRVVHNLGLNILWASRIAKQKNYKLLAEIINRSPSSYSFSVWGSGDQNCIQEFKNLLKPMAKVTIHGPYASFDTLPLEDYDAFLYTSLWDGTPNALLEASAFAFPVVASNVGGIAEVISPDRGWLIDDFDDPEPYLRALAEIGRDKTGARDKGSRLAEFVSANHSRAQFEEAISGANHFLD